MSRKIYALMVLIGALGFLVLIYLYFFVYYTATVVIQSNIEEYSVEFFSKSTAQTWEYDCPEKECLIADVSPFEYNIVIKKEDYKDEVINTKIMPRKKQNFVVELEKETRLQSIEIEEIIETPKQKIQRLRNEGKYFVSFYLSKQTQVHLKQEQNQLEMIYVTNGTQRIITSFPLVSEEEINIEYIGYQQRDLFMQFGSSYYIFSLQEGRLYTLPYSLQVLYIKPAAVLGEYLVVTEKGTFIYNISTQDSEFQYLFKDFIFNNDTLIGVIYKDEDQKKQNFNLTEKGNLIIQYTPQTKERKVLLKTDISIDRIEWREDDIVFFSGEREYQLENF